jgi:hypothetical protein
MIELLRHNDIYPPPHDLYDLATHPRQATRALSLIGNQESAGAGVTAFGTLKDDPDWRLIAGARFPDESPSRRYSSLQPERYNNVVVPGIVDLFCPRQNDPAVKQLLASIESVNATTEKTLATGSSVNRTVVLHQSTGQGSRRASPFS